MRPERQRFLRQRGAVVLIQRHVRRYIEEGGRKRRLQAAAATAIQSAWRMHAARAAYARTKAAATTLQAAWRGRVTQGTYQQQRHAAVAMQCAWRSLGAKRMLATFVQEKDAREAAAATSIQAMWRGDTCSAGSTLTCVVPS